MTASADRSSCAAYLRNTRIAESRAFLAKVQGQGFPTFALQDSEGQLRQIPAGNYLGNVDAWKALLSGAVNWA